ncbi:hypothetical protein SKAU_G00034000 [Synaphobranchus kaupii]|uniref:Uncharacterized protein n=1 Tax=Synaphobranchus kaupii TaxID=118154 RepID=A0A9Q1GGG0_SYNKA|nr:hypothetical protein SKAU_G00034000 [Synaphobranchus kaupii]
MYYPVQEPRVTNDHCFDEYKLTIYKCTSLPLLVNCGGSHQQIDRLRHTIRPPAICLGELRWRAPRNGRSVVFRQWRAALTLLGKRAEVFRLEVLGVALLDARLRRHLS